MTTATQVSVEEAREWREGFDKLEHDLLYKKFICYSAPGHHYPMGTQASTAGCLSFDRYNKDANNF